jgi:GT2 family glycosyltransferase
MVLLHRGLGAPDAPICTVCIANYNGCALLADCIDSILAQSFAGAIEILVHDDASTDDSVAWLRDRHPQVTVLASDTNVGFCIGNNRMADVAKGRFLLLLNNDAALFPDAIESLVSAADADETDTVLTLPQFDWQTGALIDRGCLLDPFYNPIPNIDPARTDVAMTIGACLWIPKGLWQTMGGFPEWMESIGEDLYLCCAARLRGARVAALEQSGYRHWQGKTFGGNRVFDETLVSTMRRRRLSERNKTFAMMTCTPTALMWPLLGAHLLMLLVEGLVLAAVRRDRGLLAEIYLNVPREVRRQWSLLIQLRAANLAARRIGLASYLGAFRPWPRKLVMLARYGLPRVHR